MRKLFVFAALAAVSVSLYAGPVIKQEHKDRAADLVSKMTLEEKIGFVAGKDDGFKTLAIPRLGIPSIRMADGPQGVRNVDGKNIPSTFYPCGVSAAATWNRSAVYQMGEGIGKAAKAHGVQIMLGPGVNIYRSALCGRNFEYYGEDPYLASETALAYITGMQEQGVMSTIKHFALNQQEYDRHGVSSNADERTMNEIYFPTFRKAVEKGHVGAVMTSYNPVNGMHAAENTWLVNDNLRAWGHDGIVMTDWTSTYSTVGFIQGGVDLEMPRAFDMNPELVQELVKNGVISEKELDVKCINILQTFIAYGFLDSSLEAVPEAEDRAAAKKSAYELALEGPVLLKNEDNILPIKKGTKIALVGPNANVIVCGGGSGWVNPEDGAAITPYVGLSSLGGVSLLGGPDPEKLRKAQVVIVCIGFNRDTETEGRDRKYKLDSYQNDLVATVASYNPNVIVVANSGGEFGMPWADKAKAIILDWYPGQEGGNALAAIISGKVSPSGRLPFTWWGAENKNPVQKWYKPQPLHPNSNRDKYPFAEYREGIFLGYRGVEHFDAEPLYPFGYGLTYGDMEYSNLSVVSAGDGFDVSFDVKNAGKIAAKEVAQVYVAPVDPSVVRPARELKGYDKCLVAPGKTVHYTIHLDGDAFMHYDVTSHSWVADKGTYTIQVGASSQDIKLEASVQL